MVWSLSALIPRYGRPKLRPSYALTNSVRVSGSVLARIQALCSRTLTSRRASGLTMTRRSAFHPANIFYYPHDILGSPSCRCLQHREQMVQGLTVLNGDDRIFSNTCTSPFRTSVLFSVIPQKYECNQVCHNLSQDIVPPIICTLEGRTTNSSEISCFHSPEGGSFFASSTGCILFYVHGIF